MAKRRLTARQTRFLFASGIFSRSGGGGKGGVKYNKARAAQVHRQQKRGVDVTSRTKARKNPANLRSAKGSRSARPVIGGSAVSGLRSGSGSGRAGRDARISETRRRTERGFLPGAFRAERDSMASAMRTRRRGEHEALERARAYEAKGDLTSARRERDSARRSRQGAYRYIAQAKSENPRLSRAEAREYSREQKAFRVSERKAETAALRANKTIAAVRQAQRNTYNGWSSDPKEQKTRYARLKNLERAIQRKYGVR